ncbi:Protein OS-9 like protein [Cladophialophora carrionii]|uniref:Endoplasmic reticulum lectin n=1 Tax=Cladophialophora carrionii TaxID=86049 RepID=A0A1C1CLP1_9EURO|nr:Protein OS-9 like protein [Cladophialophora carrionii]
MGGLHVLGGVVLLLAALCRSSEAVFSVNDDLFAFPQYKIEFTDLYIPEADAISLLESKATNGPEAPQPLRSDVSSSINPDTHDGLVGEDAGQLGSYERLLLHGYPHLCFIPEAKPAAANGTAPEPSAEDRENELSRAVDRASQLLQGMASNQCLYYSTGWWTYSFCYNSQVTQFHALPPGTNGRVWPPQEDPTTPSYILGKFETPKPSDANTQPTSDNALSTEVKSKAETNYLVQRLTGGTPCDLTGNDRKIEVQFHCNPQLTDRIGWIKETATCAYMMIIYTPRLCNDVAFQPPKESRAHSITCREIVPENEIGDWQARRDAEKVIQQRIDQGQSQQIVLGGIEVGAMKLVGREGKRLERGRIVLTQDEKAETVIMQKNGQISGMSKAQLKKLDLSQEDIDAFQKELQKLAAGKDWKIERLDDVNGHIQLRGVVSNDDDEEEDENGAQQNAGDKGAPDEDNDATGSQEEYAKGI